MFKHEFGLKLGQLEKHPHKQKMDHRKHFQFYNKILFGVGNLLRQMFKLYLKIKTYVAGWSKDPLYQTV